MNKFSIEEIEQKLFGEVPPSKNFISKAKKDSRKGVQLLVKKWDKQEEQARKLKEKFDEMNHFERKCRAEGFIRIAGIDEVGRGPLAGPVVAAAVILGEHFYLPGIDDSKKLTEQKREGLYEQICLQAEEISIGMVHAKEIDEINIYEASKKAMLSAVSGLSNPDFLLIDAMTLLTPYPQEAIIKGDSKSVSIAAASIVAKVTRDRLMKEIGEQYPQFGFAKNMGYGTPEHLQAIEKYGITKYHRKSFAPIKNKEIFE